MKGLFGGILFGCGLLIATLSGLCCGVLLVSSLFSGEQPGDVIPLVAMFGAVPLAIGLGLFFWGRALMRSARRDTDDPAKDF